MYGLLFVFLCIIIIDCLRLCWKLAYDKFALYIAFLMFLVSVAWQNGHRWIIWAGYVDWRIKFTVHWIHVIVLQSKQINGVSWICRQALQAPVIIGERREKNECTLKWFLMVLYVLLGCLLCEVRREIERGWKLSFLSRSGLSYLSFPIILIHFWILILIKVASGWIVLKKICRSSHRGSCLPANYSVPRMTY